MSSAGWMTTKKRGRDDGRIAKDRSKAKAARKRKTPNARKTGGTKVRQRQQSLDDFIVDDDEEVDDPEVTYHSETDEELELCSKEKSPKNSTTTTVASSDESLSETETLMAAFPKRTSRPSAPLQAAFRGFGRTKMSKSKPTAKLSYDDGGDCLVDTPVKKKAKKPKQLRTASIPRSQAETKKVSQSSFFMQSDDSDEDEAVMMGSSKPSPGRKAGNKKCLATKEEKKKVRPLERKTISTPASETSKYFPRSADALSDDDSPLPEPAPRRKPFIVEEEVANDYEAIGLAQALKESQEEYEQRFKGSSSVPSNEPIMLDHDDEEESDNDAEVDEYVSNEGQAKSVLDAANELSAKVLQTMSNWSKQQNSDATKGIIVDGALALSNFDATCVSGHSWISEEDMKLACPDVKLADYQLIGVNWLALLHGLKVDVGDHKVTTVNGVLADSMGLGKTVQTIAFLAWLKRNNSRQHGATKDAAIELSDTDDESEPSSPAVRPHLIIVPSSVLSNWENEFKKFCPEMEVVKYHGSQTERAELRATLRAFLPNRRKPSAHSKLDVILTTFAYFSSERSDDRSFLRKFNFDYMVVDEAHCLKNPQGARYKNMDKFETSHRLLLTGTPVQNSPKELMSLLCFLMPLFSRKSSRDAWDDRDRNDGGDRMLRHFVSLERGDGRSDEAAYTKLKQLFAPFVLRRRKEDALQQLLPPKVKRVEFVPFGKSTREVYDSILSTHLSRRANSGELGSLSSQQHLFTSLRKAANHPLLLRMRHKSDDDIDHLADCLMQYGFFGRDATLSKKLVRAELDSFSDFDIHCVALEMIEEDPSWQPKMERYCLDSDCLFMSPKFNCLRDLLPSLVAEEHRILIFSQWTKCLDLLGCLIEFLNLTYLRLDGQTPITERQQLIDQFNGDPSIPVFLLSTRAGGLGINLTAADTCILHDLDFNPFNDLQAEDRCHRIGQKKPVTVIKLVTEDTVDADIYEMQERKAKMNAAILDSGAPRKSDKKGDEEEVKRMLQKTVDRYLSPVKGRKRSD